MSLIDFFLKIVDIDLVLFSYYRAKYNESMTRIVNWLTAFEY